MSKIAEAWEKLRVARLAYAEQVTKLVDQDRDRDLAGARRAFDNAARALALAVHQETMKTVIDGVMRGGDRYAEALREEINKLGETAND